MFSIGVAIITYTILVVPYYSYSTNNGPQDPILIVKAPVLLDPQASRPWRHPFVHDAQDQSIVSGVHYKARSHGSRTPT